MCLAFGFLFDVSREITYSTGLAPSYALYSDNLYASTIVYLMAHHIVAASI